jgi:hypothetical protein
MVHRVVVWGTGNVGRPAIRAVRANRDLELTAVVVADPAKVGRTAGELAGDRPSGPSATDDVAPVLEDRPDAVVYAASADFRPDEALTDIVRCLEAGADVVTTGLFPLYHPPSAPTELVEPIRAAGERGGASFFASGIDPGWAQDSLPILLSGVSAEIDEIRCQELFDYSTYHAPDAVRDLVGFGTAMDTTPPMLLETVPTSVWGPMLRVLADGLDLELGPITETTDRLPLDVTADVAGMGRFEAGTQGAMRFEVGAETDGPRLVVEHVTRITPEAAPDWPRPPAGRLGLHKLIIGGRPRIEVSISATDGSDNPAEGGNATAAARVVNAIPALADAPPGPVHPLDLPPPGFGRSERGATR